MRKPAGGVRLSFIRPMEPELVEQPPKGDSWSHEVKFDGSPLYKGRSPVRRVPPQRVKRSSNIAD